MPIILTDLQATKAAAKKIYTPTFFDSKMTGRGGATRGNLADKNAPAGVDPKLKTRPSDASVRRRSYRSGQTSYTGIPLNTIHTDCMQYLDRLSRPDSSMLVKIAHAANGKPMEVYFQMELQGITVEDTDIPDPWGGPKTTVHEFRPCYLCRFWSVADPGNPGNTVHRRIGSGGTAVPKYAIINEYWDRYSVNPMQEILNDEMDAIEKAGWVVDRNAMRDFLLSYDIYGAACARSEEWQTSIDKTIEILLDNISTYHSNDSRAMGAVKTEVKYIMSYNVPLDLYKPIYATIVKRFSPDDAREICKENLNLLLSDTLGKLDADKSQITGFSAPAPNALPKQVQSLSQEQLKAASSSEPLVLVQAGAGTGKSTMLLGRIAYMTAAGIDPADITVLSFTNAAANHIQDLNPLVHSVTIASMIHEIYSENFTGHTLSTLETIMNTIDITYPTTACTRPVIDEFQNCLKSLKNNDLNAFTEMNNFIEKNYDAVIDILNTIGQTSLELEIIICYQKIDQFTEPASVASKYLIIDEVQDNSIFEFVYTLKYVDKHKESLFIVGDSSQTLYEFRASNPRALNILENSGTFATYQLNVNYRSNQEILDFANVALRNIEANQYAKIQLQANSLAPVTEQSFLEKVRFNYHQMSKLKDLYQELPSIFSIEVRPYIEECLARHEQIGILAYTRRDVEQIGKILEQQYPNNTQISLVPKKQMPSTIFTTFIKKYWDGIQFAPYSDVVKIIRQEILSRIQFLVYSPQKALPRVQDMLNKWQTASGPTINSWISQVNKGQMSVTELLDNIKRDMISYEISENAKSQALLGQKNREQKENNMNADADFVLSTIHSAKGLEFQNVIVLYKNENDMDEEKKRMYYVAMTRAMNSEYILAYDTKASPQIQSDYETVLEELHATAPAPNSPLADKKSGKRGNRIKI